MQRLGAKVRVLRKRHKMTLTGMAHALGMVSHGYVSEIETGKKMPTMELTIKIADLFGVTVDQLVRDEQDV